MPFPALNTFIQHLNTTQTPHLEGLHFLLFRVWSAAPTSPGTHVIVLARFTQAIPSSRVTILSPGNPSVPPKSRQLIPWQESL